jgi:hypothetical protein
MDGLKIEVRVQHPHEIAKWQALQPDAHPVKVLYVLQTRISQLTLLLINTHFSFQL